MRKAITPTGVESLFGESEIIVSKTDLRGKITYANNTFLRVSNFLPEELVGAPHNIIRHPDMPRCIFKLLWDFIGAKGEIFAYVLNMAKNGDHYWVLAHVTPSYDRAGNHIGYHSNRRKPDPAAIAAVVPLYRRLRTIEARAHDPRQGMIESGAEFSRFLDEKGMAYDQFVFSL